MGFSLKGYVVERPRVGAANSPFSSTPDVLIADFGAFNAAYPASETSPRTDYLVLTTVDGKLPDAEFGWTKNEGLTPTGPAVQRFDWEGKKQSFIPLPGSSPLVAGTVSPTINTTRIKVPTPIGVMAAAPFRLSVGTTGSGTTLTTSLVTAFGAPPSGTVEILTLGSNAGELNWNPADLVTYNGQTVRFQRQSYFTTKESNGKLGVIGNNSLLLTPIPGAGQKPLIRIGYSLWLTTVERANEGAFLPNPASGTVEWAATTGMLKFNSGDIAANNGRNVYYDGTLFVRDATLPRQSLGTVKLAGDTTPQATLMTVPAPGGDIIFRVPGVVQFATAVLVTTFDSVGKQGQVQYNAGGQVQISLADRIAYGGLPLEVVIGDLPLERGLVMRFYRTPVDLAGTDPTLKDVSTIYEVEGATFADPIVPMPQVFLPSIPIDDPAYPTIITVAQGTGSFVGALPRLDVVGAPAGFGYVIDFDQGILQYARRNIDLLVMLQQATAVAVLPDPLLIDSQLSFALETAPGSGIYTPLTRNVDYLLDATAGQVYFSTTAGTRRASGSAGSFSGTTFTDTSVNFITAGVVAGDFLVVTAGAAKGVYTIASVGATTLTTDLAGATSTNLAYEVRSGKEIMADRFFQEVLIVDPNTKVERIRSLGTITNSPRLQVSLDSVSASRFRYGTSTFSSTVTVVANDGAFTAPASLPSGSVEISQTTGNLNFSNNDVLAGGLVFWVRRLTQNKDYRIQPALGFIEFTDRFLAGEEALITYTSTSDTSTVIEEPVTFLVRKEQVQDHPIPVSTVSFNPTGHRVATNPPPQVFRGGRPQVTNTQVTIDTTLSTITFLADSQLTDALPHGATLNPNERVLVDYYIYDAFGGERTTTVLVPPINLARVLITGGTNTLQIVGNYASSFPANYLLRINDDQVYLIGSTTYDAPSNTTTITLGGSQTFFDDVQDPHLFVTSGATRTVAVPFFPSYFVNELSAYDAVPRGMNVVKVVGDRTSSYKSNSVILFTNGSITDTYRVSGAKYNPDTNRTEITLTLNVARQYTSQTLKYSVRPIFEQSTTQVSTNLNPVLTFPGDPATQQYSLFRRVEGQIGQILSSPADYTIDNSGSVKLTSPLLPNEEVSIFYTGLNVISAGRRLKSTFTFVTAPSQINGIQNQVLLADYSTFSPDSFYFRVETMTNFRGETAESFEKQAKSSTPSGGPQTSNMSSPQLVEQGRESVFFQEGHLGNQDIIARSVLKFYNDAINHLEDALHAIDGRVVGDIDGRFRFDGNINNPIRLTPAAVTNQIDDLLQVSPFPLGIGTVQPIYLTGPYSRFFCTRRNLFAGPTVAGTEDGNPIAKFAFNKLASLPGEARRRSQRAQILRPYPAGTTTFEVDNATGTNDALLRPAFQAGMRVVIRDALGTTYINEAANVTVVGTSAGPPQTITLSGGPGIAVPAGATIYLSATDASTVLSDGAQNGYAMVYKFGKDLDANLDTGELLFIKRAFPFDGTLPTTFIPKILLINEVPAGDILQCDGAGLFALNTAPYKFPALTGGTVDDDGDQAVPMVGPTFDGEMTIAGGGPLNDEKAAIVPVTGTLRTATTPPYVGTGSLDVTRTIITDTTPFAGTLPSVHDLVRILDGLNGATEFRRIVAVGANTVTVDSAFATQDAGFTYTIAVSASTVTGAATFVGTTMTDLLATFLTTVKVGQTVVLTTGADIALRRQVAAVVSNTVLTLSAPFPTAAAESYRVDNPLATFGGPGSIQAILSAALATEIATINTNPASQQAALYAFFSTVFTTLVSSSTGTVLIGNLAELLDGSVNFLTAGINTAHFVYVPSGPVMGIYKITSVDSATQLTVDPPFPTNTTGISYEVVSVFGAGFTTLQDIFGILSSNASFLTSTQAFQTLVNTAVPVLLAGSPDLTAFARGLLTSDLDARHTVVQNRLNYLADPAGGPIGKIQNALSGTERLYDKRYTWIDSRINLEKGLLVGQRRAVEDRIKAQIDILNQLTKLLAVKE